MTREEALQILNIEEDEKPSGPNEDMEETLDPAEIMDRFETLIEKN